MANFFLDNSDLQFHINETDLEECVILAEHEFHNRDKFDYAPRNLEEAMDNFPKAMEQAMANMIEEVKKMQREQERSIQQEDSRIIVPGR